MPRSLCGGDGETDCFTLCTTATESLDVLIHVFLSVVVGEFIARLDAFYCVYENVPALYFWFAIRPAGMIYVASDVYTRLPINGLTLIHLKQVLTPARIFFCDGYVPADVFNDALALLEGAHGEEPEPGARSPHPNPFGV